MVTRQRPPKNRPAATPAPPLLNDVVGDGHDAADVMRTDGHEPWPEVKMPYAPVPLAERKQRIAELAYLRAQARGFAPGREMDDWLAAELEVDSLLAGQADG